MGAASSPERVLVTGATGAVGRRLLPALAAGGHSAIGLARNREGAETVVRLGAAPVIGNVLDADRMEVVMSETRPSVVIHQATSLAAVNPRRLRKTMAQTNRIRSEGTRNVVSAAEDNGVQRMVAQSIAFGYRHEGPTVLDESAPLDTAAKGGWGEAMQAVAALEDAVMGAAQIQGVVLRYGGFYGPGTAVGPDGMVAELLRARRLPIIGSGKGLNPFIHIDDVIGATLDAVERGWGIYNVVDDHPAPAREWIPALAEVLDAPAPRRVPGWLVRPVAGPQAVRVMTTQRGVSNAKARAELGWTPEFPDWRDGFRQMQVEPEGTGAVAPSHEKEVVA